MNNDNKRYICNSIVNLGSLDGIGNTNTFIIYFCAGSNNMPLGFDLRTWGTPLLPNQFIDLRYIGDSSIIYATADEDWGCKIIPRLAITVCCPHQWKTVPAFAWGKTYTDCVLCGAKQEDVA